MDKIITEEQIREVLKYRSWHYSYRNIEVLTGVSKSEAHRIVQRDREESGE